MKWLRDIPSPLPVDNPSSAFLSIMPEGDGYIGAYREFTPELSSTRTTIRSQRYGPDFELVGPSVPLTTAGEDPRTFCWRGSVWTLIELPRNKTADCDFIIIDLLTFETIYVRHDLQYAGKNWMPVPHGEGLYFVRSLDPLSVLRMNADGWCEKVFHHPGDIGRRRGGCNARFDDAGRIVGYGHETRSGDNHVPIGFTIDMERETVEFTYPAIGPVDPLTDPTAWWGDSLLCCCARVNWWVPQPIVHRVYRVSDMAAAQERRELAGSGAT